MATFKSKSVKDDSPLTRAHDSPPSLHLSAEHMKKLGIKKLPRVGSKIKFKAHAKVVSASDHQHGQSMGLDIHRMTMDDDAPGSAKEAVDNAVEEANE